MRSLLVPLADMIPEAFARASRKAAIAVPRADDALELLDDEALRREGAAAAEAAVLVLCREDSLVARVDFRRVRALVEREVHVSRGGPVHLTPLHLYLDAFSSPAIAARVVASIADALARLGLFAQAPSTRTTWRRRRRAVIARASPTRKNKGEAGAMPASPRSRAFA